ncbi:MAG TPA: protein kinase [Fimbriiglobus sp.]|jgi:serine/threonine protein kinase
MQNWDTGEEPVAGYKLIDLLGQGGFGEVWLAEAPGGVQCALKLINLKTTDTHQELKSLRLVKRLRHPNIVPVSAFWIRDRKGKVIGLDELDLSKPGSQLGVLLIAMGLGDKSLAKRLEEVSPIGTPPASRRGIDTEELLRYMEGAAKGIDYLNQPDHKLGDGDGPIIHCDIKPGNLLIVSDEAQVCDYGLARVIKPDVRRMSIAGGTVAYIPPEQIGNKPCPGTDQYSLAITYHELRTGCLPFSEEAPQAEIYRIHCEGLLDFSHYLLKPKEREVLARATRVRPTDRFPNCKQFVDELKAAVFRAPTAEIRYPSERVIPPAPISGTVNEIRFAPPTDDFPSPPVPDPRRTSRRRDTPRGSFLDELREGGRLVPGYVLSNPLATDSTGQTWLAMDRNNHDRLRVLRVIQDPLVKDRAGIVGLDAVKQVDNDHLARLYEYCFLTKQCEPIPPEKIGRGAQSPVGLVLVTEYVERSLSDRLAECLGPEGLPGVPEEELVRYLKETASALETLLATQPPVLHLRLRPEVIGLTRHGSVKLIDSGAAPFIPVEEFRSAAAYAPPEVLDGAPSARSDPYAMSLIYYKLRTGRLPFLENLDLPRQKELKKRGALDWSLVTPAERTVLTQAASPYPGDRFPTARAFADAMAQTLLPVPVDVPRRVEESPWEPEPVPPRPSGPIPSSRRETPKPTGIEETDRKSEAQSPEKKYRETIFPVPPVEFDDETGTLRPEYGPAPPAVVSLKKSWETGPKKITDKAKSASLPPPRPLPIPVPPPKSNAAIVAIAAVVGLVALGGIIYLLVSGGNKENTTPTTEQTGGGETITTANTGTGPVSRPWAEESKAIDTLVDNHDFPQAWQRLRNVNLSDDGWRKWQEKKQDSVKAAWKSWLFDQLDKPDEAKNLIAFRKSIDPNDPDRQVVDRQFERLRARALKLPDGVPSSFEDLLKKIAAAQAAAAPFADDSDTEPIKKFKTELSAYEAENRKRLFDAELKAFQTEYQKPASDTATLTAIVSHLKTIDAKRTKEQMLVEDFLTARQLVNGKEPADPGKLAALLKRLETAWQDPELKTQNGLLDVALTRLVQKFDSVKALLAKWKTLPPETMVAIKKTNDSLAETDYRTALDGLGPAMLAACRGAVPLEKTVADGLKSKIGKVRQMQSALPATSLLAKDTRVNLAEAWLTCRSSRDKVPETTTLLVGIQRPTKSGLSPEYLSALTWEACRQLQLDPKEPVADVRTATKAVALEKERISGEFQTALAIRVAEDLKRDKPDVAAICNDDDDALGWKALADADALLGKPKDRPTEAVRERIRSAIAKAKNTKLPLGISARPSQPFFDELIGYLLWATDLGTAQPAKSASDAVELIKKSDMWTAPRKARAADALRTAARLVKPLDRKDIPFLGAVYPKAAAKSAKNWLLKADELVGPDPAMSAVQALLLDAAGESKTEPARNAALAASGPLPNLPERVRLGILKADAATAANNDTAAAKAATEVAWDAEEWLQGSVNQKFSKSDRKALFDVLEKQLRTSLGPAFMSKSDESVALNARLTVLGFTFLDKIGADERNDQKQAIKQLTDAIAAAPPGRANDYKAWRATARLNLVTSPESPEWLKSNEAKTLWREMWADATDSAEKGNAQGKLIRGLARYYAYVLTEYRPLGAGEADWPTSPAQANVSPDFLKAMWADLSEACDALRDRNDPRLWYARGYVAFAVANPSQLDISVETRAKYLSDAVTAYETAQKTGYQPVSKALRGVGQSLEDWGWLASTDPGQSTDRMERAVRAFREALNPFDDLERFRIAYTTDLGRSEYLAVVFMRSRKESLDKAIATLNGVVGSNASASAQSEAAYWLGRAYTAAGRTDDAIEAYTKVGATTDKANLRNLYKGILLLEKAAKTTDPADRSSLIDRAIKGETGDIETAAFLRGRAKRIQKAAGVAAEYKPALARVTGPDRVRALANPAVLFALADVIELGDKTDRVDDLLEGLERFAWQVAPSDRAAFLLSAAKSLGRNDGRSWDRVAKLVERNAGLVLATAPVVAEWKSALAGSLAGQCPKAIADRIKAAWAK